MTMRTVPTKETSDEGVEDTHNQIVKFIQRGKKYLRFEQNGAQKKKSEDGS